MGDGRNFEKPDNSAPQPVDATAKFQEQLREAPKVGDNTNVPMEKTAALATDAKGYNFNVEGEGSQVKDAFKGTVAENQAASTERIAAVCAQQTTPEGQKIVADAAQQWMKDMGANALQQHFKTA